MLICEQNANRVTERDRNGKVVWQHVFNVPKYCKRLPNGNTFIAGQNQFIEVDKKGKTVRTVRLPDYIHYSGQLMSNGDFVYTSTGYQYRRVDRKGTVKQTFTLPRSRVGGSRYPEVAPNGDVIQANYSAREVVRINPKGKIVQTISNVNQPALPTLTPNGGILASSRNSMKVYEHNKKGKQTKTWSGNFYPWKAIRR